MGINTNGVNLTNIIIITKKSTYYVLSWLYLLNTLYVLLAINLINIMKHRHYLMRVIQSSFCKHHSLSTSYHSKMEWVLYQRKLSHLRTGKTPTVNQYCSQQWAWTSNCPRVQHLHLVCKILTLLWCSAFFCYRF